LCGLRFGNRWGDHPNGEQQTDNKSGRTQQRQRMPHPNQVARLRRRHRRRRRRLAEPFLAQFSGFVIFVKGQRLLVSSQGFFVFADALVKFAQKSVGGDEILFQPDRPSANQNSVVVSAFVRQFHRLSQQILRRNFRQLVCRFFGQIPLAAGVGFPVQGSPAVGAFFHPFPYCVSAVATKGCQL